MDIELNTLLQDESEDALLARIQEESLRYFNEVELPRRAAEQKEKEKEKRCSPSKLGVSEPQPHCSKNVDCLDNALQTPSSTPATEVFHRAPGEGSDGFHLAAGETYVYPTNYPVRQYQKAIIHSALFHNTLVSLPTGLGKTFIAAVVMYNFYRWFPQGKIVFMAPTRPLVAQQIRACHDIMAIPVKDTVEMTGAMNPTDRLQHWKTKRVFFLTPQVMANDLRTKACPPNCGAAFKCVVIDEAHRATKEYSYCHVIKELEAAGAIFRVLALSATPGSNIKAVVEVVQNLRISTLELRGEDSPDVVPYTHAKQVEPISLNLSRNITEFREQYLLTFERYARGLRESRLITCNVQNLTKFQLLKASEKLRARPPNGMNKARVGALMSDFTVCMTLAHGLELLQTYGLRAFHQYFTACEDEENRKAVFTRLNSDGEFHSLMDRLHHAISAPMDQFWSHPKHEQLVKILKDHFCQAEKEGTDTKVIIFCQYRVVVSELYELLQTTHPLIKPVMFIGQGVGKDRSGLPQKKQIEVMKGFRQGLSNVLIATCVAEEGLDIGSVDLLVMMECQRSPVRLVQRLGRTGRHRRGRCVVLLTSGREVQKFHEAMATKKSFISMIQNSNLLKSNLMRDEPQMVPLHIKPRMQLVHINVPERITPAKKKKQGDIRQALIAKMNDMDEKEVEESPFLDHDQLAEVEKELGSREVKFDSLNIGKAEYLFQRINDPPMQPDELFSDNFTRQSEFVDWNRVLHQTYLVLHSSDTEALCHLLHKSESMMLNTHADLNSQQINCSDLFPQKKTEKKAKQKNEKITKKKKNEKERKVMDIRQCLAQAAEKVRLTQNKLSEESDFADLNQNRLTEVENLETFPDPVIVEISDTTPGETIKNIKNANNEELKQSSCLLCAKSFMFSSKRSSRNSTNELLFENLGKVKSLVKNLSKEEINNINVSKMIDADSNVVNNVKNSVLRLKEKINLSVPKKIHSPLISIDDIFDHDIAGKTSPSPLLESNKTQKENVEGKEPEKKLTNIQNQDYFNLEDLFNEDEDDLCFEYLKKNTKTSTPLKTNSDRENGSKNITIMECNSISKMSDQKKVEGQKNTLLFNNKPLLNKSEISPITKLNPPSSKSVFKIPQMKLNLNSLLTPTPVKSVQNSNDAPTPGSPILSGQVTSHQNTTSPILSSQVVPNHESLLSPVLSGQVSSSHNNLSPVLSGQVTSTPKLERKVLFHVSSSKRDNSEWCKPLDSEPKHSTLEMAEIEALNLLSASQLFDDSSDEDKKDLEQSSMYTISQLVAKVSSLADKMKDSVPVKEQDNKNIETKETTSHPYFERGSEALTDKFKCSVGLNEKKNQSVKKEAIPNVNFDSSDEDSIFGQINLDDFSFRKESITSKAQVDKTNFNGSAATAKGNSTLRNQLNDSSEIEKHEIEKINQLKKANKCLSMSPGHDNPELPAKEYSQRNEESFISSRWLTCMKNPLKLNKSVSFAEEAKHFSVDSDSDSDVFESGPHKTKPRNVTGLVKPKHKPGKSSKKGARAQFVELEADVSVTGGVVSSDEENTSGLDELDESFINDMTELPSTSVDVTSVDIHAKYLQSVKSPNRGPGFKIPTLSHSILARDVYSQAVPEDDNDSYENDSFCCDATEIPIEDEPSELEIAERLLKQKFKKERKSKRKRHKSDSSSDECEDEVSKKKRLLSSSSSYEDLVNGLPRADKRKHFSSSDTSPYVLRYKKNHKKRRRVQLLTSSDSDSDKTFL